MWTGLPHPAARMGAPSCTGPVVPDVPRQLSATLELLNTGALSKRETLEFHLERKAVPGRTGSRTLELLFLLVWPRAIPCSPLETPGPLNRPFSADSRRRCSFHVCPACPPLLTVLCHRIQVWMDKPKNPTEDAAEAVPRPNHMWGCLPSTHGRKINPKPPVLSVVGTHFLCLPAARGLLQCTWSCPVVS